MFDVKQQRIAGAKDWNSSTINRGAGTDEARGMRLATGYWTKGIRR